jgi:hypothetical protein
MDTNRLSQGQMVAGVSAILLFIFSFLKWFSFSAGGLSSSYTLWEIENPLDVYLLIVILIALVPAALTLAGGGGPGGGMATVATTLLAGVGTLLILYQLFDHPPALPGGVGVNIDVSTKIGYWLGLLSCAGITIGGYLSMQEDAVGDRY